ncbi:YbaB/EbfC family DNA-binding protein [Nocardia panacis]|uniref:YbaB/EbfC family DNA-binding protein n=1 Tax=Nocardia panacis TaxID=2340916 RepID=A0A3A4JY48_9NOCA|nr:YbaB/EbfC family nucleoid-associated protein [Nocardia panacis]RJO72083.1 YbaB/EbfC family DNA-binding protein [Nocardia panacis]
MRNDSTRAQTVALLEEVQQQMVEIARIQRERALLTATATARRRVTITVNADGTVIDTQFHSDIEDLTYPEIARAMTEAAQQASADVARKAAELMTPLQERRARLPKLSELIEDMPDVRVPVAPPAPLTPARESSDFVAEFTDVEVAARLQGNGITDKSW